MSKPAVIIVRHPDHELVVDTIGDVEIHEFDLGGAFDITVGFPYDESERDDAIAMLDRVITLLETYPGNGTLESTREQLAEYIEAWRP